MKNHYDLVIFDWEGTLAEDSYGQVVSVFADEAKKMQLNNFDKALARKLVPMGLVALVSYFFSNLTIQSQERLLSNVQKSLEQVSHGVVLIEYADVIVKSLHDSGVKLGIATNRSLNSLQKVLALSGLQDYFDFIRTASQALPKPCPDMLEEIIWESSIPNSKTLMVGDSISDVEAAVAIGVDVVGVDFYHEQQNLLLESGACIEIDNYKDLLNFLV